MSPDRDDDVIRLRIPIALQVVMALDIAVAVIFVALVVLLILFVASWDARGALLPLAALLVYAIAGVWISVQLGRASRVARVGQVVWSCLLLGWCAWIWDALGTWEDWGLFVILPVLKLVAAVLTLALLFTPAVRSFFRTVHQGRLPAP